MANLYELDAMIESLLEQEDPETGELLCDMEQLEAVLMERDTKIENIALYIKNKTAEAEAIKTEKMNLEKRQKAAANKAERAKGFLEEYLKGQKFSTPKVAVSYRTSKAVILLPGFMEWANQHNEFLRYKDPEPDKTAITAALKAGDKNLAAYAELVETKSMSIK